MENLTDDLAKTHMKIAVIIASNVAIRSVQLITPAQQHIKDKRTKMKRWCTSMLIA